MTAPISFPMWLLLVAMIGTPIHFYLRQRHLQTRLSYAAFSALTIAVIWFSTSLTGPGARHSLHDIATYVVLSLSFGGIFGVPVGLILRCIVRED